MALQKQALNIPFAQGLDLKTDPNQVQAGKLLLLQNATFNKGSRIQKRNGFPLLSTLPNTDSTTLSTLNDNLLATGINLYAYSAESDQWLNRGTVQPVNLSVKPVVRNSKSQTSSDSATSTSGLSCIAFEDSSGTYYEIVDSTTGQAIITQTALPATATNARVYILGAYFVVTFLITITATPHLQYIAIPIANPSIPGSAQDISAQVKAVPTGYDAIVANNNLYVAWNGSDVGGAVRFTRISSTLVQSTTTIMAGQVADIMSVAADISGSTAVIWYTYWDTTSNDGFTFARSYNGLAILAPTQIITNVDVAKITSVATDNILTVLYETENTYTFSATRTDYVSKLTVTLAGTVSAASVVCRSIGLASKAFFYNDIIYFLAAYGQAFQPTYFLLDTSGNIIMKLAYSNGGGYYTSQILPNISIDENVIRFTYLLSDLLVPVNKSQGVVAVAGIYAQTGVNLARVEITTTQQHSEIAASLHLTGGYLWQYDTIKPVEHSFHVWPEDIEVNTSAAGGSITDQQYYYSVTYEWTDGQGMLHRSAPSIPVGVVTAGGNTSTNTLEIPTLRLTAKTGNNPVRIVIYRWSTAQQIYYQITSIQTPLLNNPAVDSVQYVDTAADSAILGNIILYTTGGVLENIAAPASIDETLFKSRLFIIDAEDDNLLWYSKQVIETTPVEMSDLLTIYVAPTAGAQGSTGGMKCISALDDKLIIFKKSSMYYVTGTGPDNTGANNDFSEPIFITSTVGCVNPNSIVQTPLGLMFQSDKGIWLLGRDLNTTYVGSEVEEFNSSLVQSAVCVPGTNQVRFTMDTGEVLMYDYYFGQWGSFIGIPAISSTLYRDMHVLLNQFGQVLQEQIGSYMDVTNPVLMKLSTAWIKLTDLQGFQRAYFVYLLSNYRTPHKLNIEVAYDYDPVPKQSSIIIPNNVNLNWGDEQLWGSGEVWGGPNDLEQWRIFLRQQKCEAVRVTITEIFDSSLADMPGAGLVMSGLNFVVGGKASYPKLKSTQSVG